MTALLALLAAALAAPDAHDTLRALTVREAGIDQILGAPQGPAWDAWRWEDADPADPIVAEALDLLRSDVAPEAEGHEWPLRGPVLAARPRLFASFGDLVPAHADGDAESGLLTARAEIEGWLGYGPLEARVVARVGGDIAPISGVAGIPEWRLGARTRGFTAAISQESRWFGPGRHGTLLYTDAARPLPAIEVAGDSRLPGKAAVIGRFSAHALVGFLPGERRDVDRPGWLILDLRYAPVPWIEVGATRNALFGGSEDGVGKPIDWGQLLLPTDPHVEGDPNRTQADTDERAALDARITAPIGRLGLPVDYVEVYIQHGGEDVIARRLGPIPFPSLAGAANVYGAEIAMGPWFLGAEGAVVEDDLYRWYVGHRQYHDGWTVDGVPVGHPRGGDQASTVIRAGRVAAGQISVEVSWEHVRRVQIADLVEDTLFVFPMAEVRDEVVVRVSRPGLASSGWSVEAGGGPVRSEGFVPGEDHFSYRLAVEWRPKAIVRHSARAPAP